MTEAVWSTSRRQPVPSPESQGRKNLSGSLGIIPPEAGWKAKSHFPQEMVRCWKYKRRTKQENPDNQSSVPLPRHLEPSLQVGEPQETKADIGSLLKNSLL